MLYLYTIFIVFSALLIAPMNCFLCFCPQRDSSRYGYDTEDDTNFDVSKDVRGINSHDLHYIAITCPLITFDVISCHVMSFRYLFSWVVLLLLLLGCIAIIATGSPMISLQRF
jgi:hypothetical protein